MILGCVSRIRVGSEVIDLHAQTVASVGVTTCETCAATSSSKTCDNGGVCQEANNEVGHRQGRLP